MNKPLNIVFFPQSVNYGLAGTNRLQNIIYYLRKDGIMSVSNIALEDRPRLSEIEEAQLFLSSYREICYGPSPGVFFKHIFQTAWYLYKFRKSDYRNLIYFYGEIDIKNFYFVIWARLLGYKVVIDIVEDLEAFTRFKSFKNKLKYKSAVFFRRYLHFFADGFTVVSGFLEEKIRRKFGRKPIFFLPVTINKYLIRDFQASGQAPELTVFYSGSFNEKDGLTFLLQALSWIKAEGFTFRLMLSGKGTESEMKQFWTEVDQCGLKQEVEYKGVLSRDEYVRVLNSEAEVLCMTRVNSRYANAGFPFKLGEFLFTGKPVIASKVGDVERYLSPDDAYLVEPENPEQIKMALINIIADRKAANEVGQNGRKAALKYFDHELYAPRLKEFMMAIS